MAKVRRKSNGCRRGAFKQKRMGKGWAAMRKQRGRPQPVPRKEMEAAEAEAKAAKAAEAAASSED